MSKISISIVLALLVVTANCAQADFGHAYIYAPAVLSLNKGLLAKLGLNVTYGSGNVNIKGPSEIDPTTLQSAQTAVKYAAGYLSMNQSLYNFTYTIYDNSTSVSGPSGGFAFTLLAISALSHQQLLHNFTVTGTIAGDGSIGQIGGIYEKAQAAKQNGMRFMLISSTSNSSFENILYYIAQQDLGMPLVKVSNITQAIPFAFGPSQPKPFTFDIYQDYHLSQLPDWNASCSACSTTSFSGLVDVTINMTDLLINNITGNYSGMKQNLLSSLNSYGTIGQKGYLYTSADFAFLEFITTFVFSNHNNLNKNSAALVISDVSSYCSSLNPPLTTTQNYEYVVGGEVRQTWANTTLSDAQTALSSAETTDDIAQGIYMAGEAYAWCFAANSMYSIASNMSGNYVALSRNVSQKAVALISSAQNHGSSLYLQSAINDYKSGLYGAALYNAEYALAFGNASTSNYSRQMLLSRIHANMANSTYGIWPYEFAAQASFYVNEAGLQANSSEASSMITNAYTVSVLAARLDSANRLMANSFTFTPLNSGSTGQCNCTAINDIDSQVSMIYVMLLVIIVLIFFELLILLAILLKLHGQASTPKPQRAGRARKR